MAGGTLSGRITSTSGGAVANAHLTIKNTANSETQIITANEDGSFSLPNFSPGIFELTVAAPGSAESRTTVRIGAGMDSRGGHRDAYPKQYERRRRGSIGHQWGREFQERGRSASQWAVSFRFVYLAMTRDRFVVH